MTFYLNIAFLFSSVGFIFGIKLMGNPSSAKKGNIIAALAMILAIISTIIAVTSEEKKYLNLIYLGISLLAGHLIGKYLSDKAKMTEMPQFVSLLNAFGGFTAIIIGINQALLNNAIDDSFWINLMLIISTVLGGLSAVGSIVAFFKLSGKNLPFQRKSITYLSLSSILLVLIIILDYSSLNILSLNLFNVIVITGSLSLVYGYLLAIPIGGADMPVLISFLNSITGVATALCGIAFNSPIMLIGGIIVGATGLFLTQNMCVAMNRKLVKVLFGNKAHKTSLKTNEGEIDSIQSITRLEVAAILAFSKNVAIVPGFGLAVSQAQQLCYELQKKLNETGINLKYIIHPVAGRMPGHMNVLLAEANIDYTHLLEMEEANAIMETFDLVLVIGANDVVNPNAEDDPTCSIYGMPIIKTHKAKQVIVLKRGMSKGYSGENNPLFNKPNCRLLFGDAKNSLSEIIQELKKI